MVGGVGGSGFFSLSPPPPPPPSAPVLVGSIGRRTLAWTGRVVALAPPPPLLHATQRAHEDGHAGVVTDPMSSCACVHAAAGVRLGRLHGQDLHVRGRCGGSVLHHCWGAHARPGCSGGAVAAGYASPCSVHTHARTRKHTLTRAFVTLPPPHAPSTPPSRSPPHGRPTLCPTLRCQLCLHWRLRC